MSQSDDPEEALYTLFFLSGLQPPSRLAGLKQIHCKDLDGDIFVSEWLIIKPEFKKIEKQLPNFDVRMMQFRVYKPDKGKWCVIDWQLLQKAIEFRYTIVV